MSLKSQKGYSLIEIGIGILILTVFLISSMALFNGCYNTYRRIQQRNVATNLAVKNMEEVLQTDAGVLTGFFIESSDPSGDGMNLQLNEDFDRYIEEHFDLFVDRYAKLNGVEAEEVGSIGEEERKKYALQDAEYVINAYIQNSLTEEELADPKVQEGNYGFLEQDISNGSETKRVTNVIYTGNPDLLLAEEESLKEQVILGNDQGMLVKKTIMRLPIQEGKAFGNRVLKVRVDVYYTDKINKTDLRAEDRQVLTLQSIKVSG